MAAIIIKLYPNANELKLVEAIQLFKGVKSASIVNDRDILDLFMANQMAKSRKSGRGNKDKILEFLMN